jgi:arylsulfatase A-like enzyme
LFWYCGDNGTPSSGQLATPLRGEKAQMYEGGIRVPGLIEWPSRITQPRTTSVNAVTSDMLPTLCALAGCQLPDRPLDGIDLSPLIDGQMTQRSSPICFWAFDMSSIQSTELEPYIDPDLQKGTTPLVKLMNGIATRNFENYHHPKSSLADIGGPRVFLDNDFKLVIDQSATTAKELYDLGDDPAEEINLISQQPQRAHQMERRLNAWRSSVLNSLSGGDYN